MKYIKKIDPLYILAGAFFLFIISLLLLNMMKTNLKSKKNDYNHYETLALKYNNLNSSWGNLKIQKKIIEKILISVNQSETNVKYNKNKISVDIQNIKIEKINSLINKILNKKLNIKNLTITDSSIKFEVVK